MAFASRFQTCCCCTWALSFAISGIDFDQTNVMNCTCIMNLSFANNCVFLTKAQLHLIEKRPHLIYPWAFMDASWMLPYLISSCMLPFQAWDLPVFVLHLHLTLMNWTLISAHCLPRSDHSSRWRCFILGASFKGLGIGVGHQPAWPGLAKAVAQSVQPLKSSECRASQELRVYSLSRGGAWHL